MAKDLFGEPIIEDNVGKHRFTESEKNANDKQWYREYADRLDSRSFTDRLSNLQDFDKENVSHGKKINYDLFNNIINKDHLNYVIKPFGEEVGELPARFKNRDIVSGKIKVLLGMEETMPFSWGIVAVNDEATSRKEEAKFGKIRDFVVNEIMSPIRQQVEQQAYAQLKGRQPTPEEEQQIQAQVEEELKTLTPDEVEHYMQRHHKDPAEVLMRGILKYLIPKTKAYEKFNLGFKHLCLGAKEVFHVGIFNGQPDFFPVNSLRFDCDQSEDLEYIEDGEWAVHEIPMTPSQALIRFSGKLKDEEIDRLYDCMTNPNMQAMTDSDFSFSSGQDTTHTIRVLHATFKAPAKVGILRYWDGAGEEQKMLVDDTYKLNKKAGDIDVKWEWIPQAYEVYKILNDIYVDARPVPGQFRDIDNLFICKLPYYGAICDNLNSTPTAPMDRMVDYQYLYDIILYRMENLMASDKGKILAANIGALPRSAGITMEKFMYFAEANKMAWFNNQEEGKKSKQAIGGDASSLFSVLDMSLVSDISKYMQIAEYIDTKCGNAIGVTKQMEAQIGADESVNNTKQNLVQASYIIRPYYTLHNTVKGNVLTALMENGKVAYSAEDAPDYLNYNLDDMSLQLLHLDKDLLAASSYGLFIGDATKAFEAKQLIVQLSQAAMQNQQASILDIIKVVKSDSIQEAEELLAVAKAEADELMQANEKAKNEAQKANLDMAQKYKREEWTEQRAQIVLKAQEDRKTKVQVEAMAALGYDPNKDEDGDGEPDVIEVMKHGLDAEIKKGKLEQDAQHLDIEQQKLEETQKMNAHQIEMDKHKKLIDSQKIEIDRKKANKPTGK